MNEEVKKILEKLNKGKINTGEAIQLIKAIGVNQPIKPIKKASKIKIRIIDQEENKSIKLPGIPFWVASSLGKMALKFSVKTNDTMEKDEINEIKALRNIDLKEIFKVLRAYGPYDIVHVVEDSGSEVRISIL